MCLADRKTQWVKALVARTDTMRSVLGTHMAEGES